MTVIKNQKSNTYEVRTYYKDWTGVRKQKTKRGFKRKCDAQEWERAFKLKENLSLDMYFEDFVDLYLNDIKSRIKYNTYQIIRQLNKELSGMGLITVPGRVDANYFKKKLFYEEK